MTKLKKMKKGWVFNIQRYSIQDGPGIRTTVFLMGCPLTCLWCDNPESQKLFPQLLFFDSLCQKCYRCLTVCPNDATSKDEDGNIKINRELCQTCGSCAQVCPTQARVISGKLMSVEEVVEVVKKDSLFYRNSDGGVTISGGEATSQPRFLLNLLKKCYEHGFHTTLDTCGYVEWAVLEEILEYVDLVLYDLKHMDETKHMELTGVGNYLILENFTKIFQKGIPLIPRIVLIPGCNDSQENINDLGRFLAKQGVRQVDLLPYHQLGVKKYERLGMKYPLNDVKLYSHDQVEVIQRILEHYGLKSEVV